MSEIKYICGVCRDKVKLPYLGYSINDKEINCCDNCGSKTYIRRLDSDRFNEVFNISSKNKCNCQIGIIETNYDEDGDSFLVYMGEKNKCILKKMIKFNFCPKCGKYLVNNEDIQKIT